VKYLTEFRDEAIARKISADIKNAVTRPWKIMEVCGGQTHTILQYGIEDLLPPDIDLLHGPGCPVCVTPLELIDRAVAIARLQDVTLCSYGDMLRVPGSDGDLLGTRAAGADVRIVYSPLEALEIARQNPERRIVFFAVGFETTAPANAMSVYQAKKLGLKNFFLLCSHVTVPPVMASMLKSPDNRVQGFLGPGHVCSVMGSKAYEEISCLYRVPIVISGFEPIDILQSILMCVQQLESGRAEVENQYARAVREQGNTEALRILAQVFKESDRQWRGLGHIAESGYKLTDAYAAFDAEKCFNVETISCPESTVCISGEILKGLKKPFQCPAFGKECTPENPLGATMVSSEGTCANYYKFGKFGQGAKHGS
jgi:hydrogenase expression/formation protein HypD